MKKTVILAVLVLGSAACFASRAKRYFELKIPVSEAAGPVFDRALLLDRPEVNELYDDFRIIYRVSPTEINYYSGDFWAEKPSRLIRNVLFQRLARPGLFRRLDAEEGKDNTDWIWRTRVIRIEEVDEGERWSARLAMTFEIVDFRSGARIAARTFDRSEPLGRKDVALLPGVLSAILAGEIDVFLSETASKIRS